MIEIRNSPDFRMTLCLSTVVISMINLFYCLVLFKFHVKRYFASRAQLCPKISVSINDVTSDSPRDAKLLNFSNGYLAALNYFQSIFHERF